MSTTQENVVPTEVSFVVCEDIREEKGARVSLLGVYGGGNIVLYGDELVAGAAIEGLTIYAVFKGGSGEFQVQINVTPPGGTPIEKPAKTVELKPGVAHQMVLKMRPFMVPSLGIYHFDFVFNDHVFRLDVPISLQPLPANY